MSVRWALFIAEQKKKVKIVFNFICQWTRRRPSNMNELQTPHGVEQFLRSQLLRNLFLTLCKPKAYYHGNSLISVLNESSYSNKVPASGISLPGFPVKSVYALLMFPFVLHILPLSSTWISSHFNTASKIYIIELFNLRFSPFSLYSSSSGFRYFRSTVFKHLPKVGGQFSHPYKTTGKSYFGIYFIFLDDKKGTKYSETNGRKHFPMFISSLKFYILMHFGFVAVIPKG